MSRVNRRFESLLMALFGLIFLAGLAWQAGVFEGAGEPEFGQRSEQVDQFDDNDNTSDRAITFDSDLSDQGPSESRSDGTVVVYDWVVDVGELPDEAIDTLVLIDENGPYPFSQDDSDFQNREGLLPDQQRGYYREYTVITPDLDHRGARRIVSGADGELFYTSDHYDSFAQIVGW